MSAGNDIDTGTGGSDRSPEEIQREIIETRANIKQDVKAIGEKFTPAQIKENAKGVLADAKEEGATMVRDVKDSAVGSLRSARDNAVEAVSETVHDLGERAREAGAITADYARQAGEYARDAGSATASFVAANAIPLSLIGLGVGWLALSMRSRTQTRYIDERYEDEYEVDYDDYYFEGDEPQPGRRGRTRRLTDSVRGRAAGARDRVGEAAHGARDRAEHLVEGARERAQSIAQSARDVAGNVAEGARELAGTARERVGAAAERASTSLDVARTRVSEQASHLSHEARERVYRAQLRTRELADENPLALGAIAIATGVGVGLLLPATQPENRLMGETRDRLLGDARGLIDEARRAGDIVGQKARDAVQDVRNAAHEARVSH